MFRTADVRVSQLAAEVDILCKLPSESDAAESLRTVVDAHAGELRRTVHHRRDLEAIFGGAFIYFVLALIAITLINIENRWAAIAAVPVALAALVSLIVAIRGFEKVPRSPDGQRRKTFAGAETRPDLSPGAGRYEDER